MFGGKTIGPYSLLKQIPAYGGSGGLAIKIQEESLKFHSLKKETEQWVLFTSIRANRGWTGLFVSRPPSPLSPNGLTYSRIRSETLAPRQKSFVIPRDTLVTTYYLLTITANIMAAIHYLFCFSPFNTPFHLLYLERESAYLPHRSLPSSTSIPPIFALSLHYQVSTILHKGEEKKEEGNSKKAFKELVLVTYES